MIKRSAFTLIELLVVIAIIGILATLVVTQVSGARQRASNSNARTDITQMGKAVELYKVDTTNPTSAIIASRGATATQYGFLLKGSTANPNTNNPSACPTANRVAVCGFVSSATAPMLQTGSAVTFPALFSGSISFGSPTNTYGSSLAGSYGVQINKTPAATIAYVYYATEPTGVAPCYLIGANALDAGGTGKAFAVKNGASIEGTDEKTLPAAGCVGTVGGTASTVSIEVN